jgi:anti-sigma factor RsiW
MDDDAQLVALLDGELDERTRSRLLVRIASDENLRSRYDALREAGASLALELESLLEEAPLSRLRTALLPEHRGGEASPRFPQVSFRALAAGVALCITAAGVGAWLALTLATPSKADWRSAVADYTNLYTNETFSPLRPDTSLEALELGAVGQRVGVKLTPESIALPGLRFTVAFMLSFKSSPLGAIAYVDAEGAPIMFCIIDNHGPDTPPRSERRGDISLASWSRAGRGYLVIGRIPVERAVELAQSLEKRV